MLMDSRPQIAAAEFNGTGSGSASADAPSDAEARLALNKRLLKKGGDEMRMSEARLRRARLEM